MGDKGGQKDKNKGQKQKVAIKAGLSMAPLSIRTEPLDCAVAQTLIAALNAELSQQYPEPGANHFRLDDAEVSPGRGVFLVAYWEHQPVGCGALRRLDSNTAELKRMYVLASFRGHGIGRALLDALAEEAHALGASQLMLETGVRQREAMNLYERAGFRTVPAFGEYVNAPLSICMSKRL